MLSRRAFRRTGRQLDVAEWCKQHLTQIKDIRAQHCREEPGIGTYMKWGVDFVRDTRTARKKRKEEIKDNAAATTTADTDGIDSPVNQMMRSMELTRRFKWKRVTWDKGSDFDAFSNRLINSNAPNQVPAFSFLCMHLIRDRVNVAVAPDANKSKKSDATTAAPVDESPMPKLSTVTSHLKSGDITNWFFAESDESPAAAAAANNNNNNKDDDDDAVSVLKKRRAEATPLRSPFRVDWDAGEVYILDTASAEEVLSFLRGPAQSLQALQSRRGDEETQLSADMDATRNMLHAFSIKVNEFDRTSYSDPDRRANPRQYVDPVDVKRFCDSVARNSLVMRYYLKDQHVRILSRGSAYRIDPQTREICIPADFEEYHTASIHGLVRPLQSTIIAIRKTWVVWGILLLVTIGDTEFI